MNLVYRYGLLEPTANRDLVLEQISLAHRYYNQLVELFRARKAAEAQIVDADAGVVRLRAVAADEETTDKKAAWAAVKAMVKTVRETNAEPLAKLKENYREQCRKARAECGVFWGTYLLVEQAFQTACSKTSEPKFRRWTGEGTVGIELIHGLLAAEALGEMDRRLRIEGVEHRLDPATGRRRLGKLSLRVQSHGRDPVWAEWPLIYHRPLPATAKISWASVHRVRTANHFRWHLTITLEISEETAVPAEGAFAVNLHWNRQGDDLRVADWFDGQTGGDLLMESQVREALRWVEELQSQRDLRFNEEIKGLFIESMRNLKLPETLRERFASAHLWKSPQRLAAFYHEWKANRCEPDEDGHAPDDEIFAKVADWQRWDLTRWREEAHLRKRALLRRREQYRVFAARAAEKFGTLILEKLNIARLATVEPPPNADASHPKARSQRFETAPSELRLCLLNAFKRRGRKIVLVPAGMTSEKMWQHFRERGGDELAKPGARSLRFKRMRGIVDEKPDSAAAK